MEASPDSTQAYDVKKPRAITIAWCDRKECYLHKKQKWWISLSGVRICAICAAPPDESFVLRWEEFIEGD